MARSANNAPMFDEDEVRSTHELLPRLIRVIFFGLGITNNEYTNYYYNFFRAVFPDKTHKEFIQKAAADRKFLQERHKLTFNMLRNVVQAMGWDVESVSLEIRNRLTGEVRVFSTRDTVEMLKENLEKDQQIGVDSII